LQAEPNKVLGVFGISTRTVEKDLEEAFSEVAKVEKVVIVYDARVRSLPSLSVQDWTDERVCVE
jgi:transformer-2 protein